MSLIQTKKEATAKKLIKKEDLQKKKDAAVRSGKVDFSVFKKSDEEKALLKQLKKGAIKSSSNKMIFQF